MRTQKLLLIAFFLLSIFTTNAQTYNFTSPPGHGAGTTGGAGQTIYVVNGAGFAGALGSNRIVILEAGETATISYYDLKEKSNITILGQTGAILKASGGDLGGTFRINKCNNIIMRNLIFQGPGTGNKDDDNNDNLTIENSHGVWIDHCEFRDGADGNCDIKAGSSDISMTWNKFWYPKNLTVDGDLHQFTNLVGSSDGDDGGDPNDRFNMTWQYNWWSTGCAQRMPSLRNSEAHIINNYWNTPGNDVGLMARLNSNIYVEGCYFDNVDSPIDDDKSVSTTHCNVRPSNVFVSCSGNQASINGSNGAPGYAYELTDATVARDAIISACGAGATLEITTTAVVSSGCAGPLLNLTSGTADQSVVSGTAITPIVYTWGGTATGVTTSALPTGLSGSNTGGNTYTITGTPTAGGSFTVTTTSPDPEVSETGSIALTLATPTGVTASASGVDVNVNWNTVAGASGYVVNLCVAGSGIVDQWDFQGAWTIDATDEDANIVLVDPVTDNERFRYNPTTSDDELEFEGGGIIPDTEGLLFTQAGGDKLRLGFGPTRKRIYLNGEDITVTIPCTAGDKVTVFGEAGSGTAVDRGFSVSKATLNTTESSSEINASGIVTVAGVDVNWVYDVTGTDIVITTVTGGMNIFSITVEGAGGGTCTTYPVAGGGTTSYTISGLDPTTEYTYQVKAVNGTPSQDSPYSTEQSVTTGLAGPPVNATISAANPAGSNNQTVTVSLPITTISYTYTGAFNNVSWTGTASASTLPTGITVDSSTPGTVTISGTPSVIGSYGFTVNINGTNGGSPISATGTINATAPNALDIPSNITATPTGTTVALDWDDVTDATGYVVSFCETAGGPAAGDINALLDDDNDLGGYYELSSGDNLYTAASVGNDATSCKPLGETGTVYRTGSMNDHQLELVTTPSVTTIKIGGRSSGTTSDRFVSSYTINGGPTLTAGISGQITAQDCSTEITISGLSLDIGDIVAFDFDGSNVQLSYFILTTTGAAAPPCTEYIVAGGTNSNYTVTGLDPLTDYTYQVKATNAVPAEESPYSVSTGVTTTDLSTPASITLTSAASTTSQVLLTNTIISPITYDYVGTFNSIVWTGTAGPSTPPAGITTNTATPNWMMFSGTPTTAGTYGYTINIDGLNGGANATATGTIGVNNPTPVCTVCIGTVFEFTTPTGTPSSTILCNITATGLFDDISIDLTGGPFEISTDGGTTWGTSLTITNSGGTASATMEVRFNPTIAGIYDNTLVISTLYMTNQILALHGETDDPNVAPSVSISSPTTGVCALEGSTITLTANASDTDGTISSVEFYNGASLIGTASGTGPFYTYNWTVPASGAYTITAQATDNGTATTTSTAITVNSYPTVTLTGAVNLDEINCTVPSYTLGYSTSSGTIASQLWSTTGTTNTIAATDAGAYSVVATMDNGCTATSNTINLTKDVAIPTVSLTGAVDNDEINCTTTSYTLGYTASSGTVTGQTWSDASTGISITTSDAGAYDVTLTMDNGCTANSNTINLTKDVAAPAVAISGEGEINCTTTSFTLTADQTATNYAWTLDGLATAGNTQSITAPVAGDYAVTVTYASGCTAVAPAVTVTEDATIPTVTLTGAVHLDEINCTTPSYTLGFSTSSGTIDSQTWSTTATSLSISATSAGTYSVDVNFTNGCSATSNSITLTEDTAIPTVTLTGALDNDEINCSTTSYTLGYSTSSGTVASQTWSDASTGNTLVTSDAGAYDVTLTMDNGCTVNSNTINLTKDISAPAVTISGEGELNCTTTSLTLTANQTATNYAWTLNGTPIGGSTQTIAATTAGDYAVTLTYANGCAAVASAVTVTEDTTVPTVTLSGAVNLDEINCTTTNYTLGFSVSAGTISSQDWSTSATTPTINVVDAGAYSVDVTLTNGCTATSNTINLTKDISAPVVTITGAGQLNCTNPTLTLTADQTATNYAWTYNATPTAGNTQAITASAVGTYAVDLTYANGCTASATSVTVTQDLTTPTVTLTGAVDNDEINCTSPSYTLAYTASVGPTVASQLWSDASTATNLVATNAGAYSVDVTFDNGCVATSNTINLTKDLTTPTVTLTGAVDNDEIDCTTTDYTLGYSISTGTVLNQTWSDASTGNTITTSTGGAYNVVVDFDNGCTATSNTINLIVDNTTPTVTLTGAVDNDEINCTTPSYTLAYTTSGGTEISRTWSDASTAASITTSDAGGYSLSIDFDNGCTGISNLITLTKDISAPAVTLSGAVDNDEINCTTPSYTLVYSTIGSVASQVWSDASTGASLTTSDAGTYSVDVLYTNGCSVTSDVINLTKDITVPTVTLTGAVNLDEINCTTPAYTLGYTTSGGTVADQTWSDASTATTLIANSAGAYSVDVNFANGCSATSNTITLTEDATIPTVTLTGAVDNDEINCTTTSYTLGFNVSTGTVASQVWSDTSTGNTLTTSDAGAYTVGVLFTNGCMATSNTINLTKDATTPTVTLTGAVNNDEINCTTASYTLGFSNSSGTVASQIWSDASTGTSLTTSDAGTYSVDVTFTNGCSATSDVISLTKDATTPTVTLTGAVNLDEINCTTPSYSLGYTFSSGTVASQTWSDASSATTLTANSAGAYSVVVDFTNGCSATSNTITLTEDATIPTITLTGAIDNDEINCTTSSYTLGYNVSAGTVASQTWSDASTGNTLTATDAGAYSVDVTLTNGCTATSNTINLTKDATAPTVTLTGAVDNDEINCTTTSYTLGYTFSSGTVASQTWSDASTAVSLTTSTAGAYSVDVNFTNGCSATSNTINLSLDATTPTVTLTGAVDNDEINCTTASYSLGYTISSGTVASQTWSDASTGIGLTTSDAGAYSVDVNFTNGCSATSNTVNLSKDVTIPTVTLSGAVDNDEINCSTTSYTLGYSVSSGTVASQAWSDASTAATLTSSDAGAYSVDVTLTNGCSASSNIINLTKDATTPTVTLTGAVNNDEINCSTSSYTLGYSVSVGTVASQVWSDASTANSLTVTGAGAYSISVTLTNGCSATSNTINITEDASIPTVTLAGAVDNDEINCINSSYSLSYMISSGTVISQLWSNGASNTSISATDAGAYSVDITFDNGCTATSNTISLTKDINAPAVSITGASDLTCTTTSLNLGSSQIATSYNWKKNTYTIASTPSITILTPGTYGLTVSYANGCTAVATDQVIIEDKLAPAVAINNSTGVNLIDCSNPSIALAANKTADSYNWRKDGIPFATTQNIVAVDAGVYVITSTYDNGCTTSAQTQLYENECEAATLTNPTANKDITIEIGTALSGISFVAAGTVVTGTILSGDLPLGIKNNAPSKNLNLYGTPTEIGTFTYTVSTVGGNTTEAMTGTIKIISKPPTVVANLDQKVKIHKEFTVDIFTWTGGNFNDIIVSGLTPDGISSDSISYRIIENDGSGSITIFSNNPIDSKDYTIKTIDENGIEHVYSGHVKARGHRVYQKGRTLHITGEPVYKVEVYSPEGKYMQIKEAVNQVELSHLLTGGYVVKITDQDKSVQCVKFVWKRNR